MGSPGRPPKGWRRLHIMVPPEVATTLRTEARARAMTVGEVVADALRTRVRFVRRPEPYS